MRWLEALEDNEAKVAKEALKEQAARSAIGEREAATAERKESDRTISEGLTKLPDGATEYARVGTDGKVTIYRANPEAPRGFDVRTPATGDFEILPA